METNAKMHYAWIVAGVTFLVLLVGSEVMATPSIIIVPLEKNFRWSAVTISAAIAVNIFLFGMIGPFAAAVMERFGIRRTVTFSLVILGLGAALTSFMRTPWQMVIPWGILIGSGTGMIAVVLGALIAERWFVRHRGLSSGLLCILAAFLATLIGSGSKRRLVAGPALENTVNTSTRVHLGMTEI